MEEHQTEEHLVSDSEEELEQPTNADASVTKSPRIVTESHNKKGKGPLKGKKLFKLKKGKLLILLLSKVRNSRLLSKMLTFSKPCDFHQKVTKNKIWWTD